MRAAPGAAVVPNEILVRFRDGVQVRTRGAAHAAIGARVLREFTTVDRLQLVRSDGSVPIDDVLKQYRERPDVLYAEPNYIVHALVTPNDTRFSELWGLHQASDADIDAPEAWDITTGSASVVVGIIDTGIDYNHPDLTTNVYRTADCDADGADDDGNGFVDDCYGIDTANADTNPFDDNSHGTHVAGTIGAAGNNGTGVVGVNWAVKLYACKFLDASGSGSTAGAIACLEYFKTMKDRGVNIVATSNSWGGGGFSQALYDAIKTHRDRGMLFMAAAGNETNDNDASPSYPASYELSNILAVAATTSTDGLASFSNYGRRTVHLGAPGSGILSTTPGNTYASYSGTSMATPHVTGVAALLAAQSPSRDWKAIKNLILAGGDPAGSLGNTVTGRRLNAFGALTCANRSVFSRLAPAGTSVSGQVGVPITLRALNINCANPGGNVSITVSGGSSVTLLDDGAAPDEIAGDGVYAGTFTPPSGGAFSLTFPNGDVVTVNILTSYVPQLVPYTYRTTTGTSLSLDDDQAAAVTTPFPILFGGGSFTQMFVASNGLISFTRSFTAYVNGTIPDGSIDTIVAPFWDDLHPRQGSAQNVYHATVGTAPNRELVVEWRDVPHYACGTTTTAVARFQIVFVEGSNDVRFNYADVTFGGTCGSNDRGASATVGVQISTTAGTQYSRNTAGLSDGTSILWTLPGTCTYVVQPLGPTAGAAGGSGTVNVTTTSDCSWTATSNNAWLSVAPATSGTGSGAVTYQVAANTSASSRTGTLTVAGPTVTVTQAGVTCTYSVSPISAQAGVGGGSGTVDVSAAASDCGWTASSNVPWLTVTGGASGTGNATVTYQAAANTSAASRTGTLAVAGKTVTVTQSGVTCGFTLNPTSAQFGDAGGTGTIALTAAASDCAWTASSADAWITITSATSGSGNATVSYAVAANETPASRTGTLTIGGQTFTVTQGGASCVYSIGPTSAQVGAAGGTGTISVTATPSGCGWTAASDAPWIMITGGASGTGNGTVSYAVAPITTSAPRTGTLTIGGQTFTVTQSGIACAYSIGLISTQVGVAGGAGAVVVTATAGDCSWTASSNVPWVTITGGATGTGTATVSYTVAPTTTSAVRTGTLTLAGQSFTVTQTGATCTFGIDPSGATATSAGGQGSTTVTASPSDCAWTATSNVAWIAVAPGASSLGSGGLDYTVAANPSSLARVGTLTAAGLTFTVTQAGVACALIVDPMSVGVPAAGGNARVTVTAPAVDCAWSATSGVPWITVTAGAAGTGSGATDVHVQPNLTAAARAGSLTIAATTVVITQLLPSVEASGVYPGTGSISGGTRVRITGLGFTLGPVTVTIGGVPCLPLEVLSDTEIVCVAGAFGGDMGTAPRAALDLVVTAGPYQATRTAVFQYVAPPTDSTTDSDGDGMPDAWEVRHSLDPLDATDRDLDLDGDGRTNVQEHLADTHPRGVVTRYLAEGATGPFFDLRLAFLNPGVLPLDVLCRFLRTDGSVITHPMTIAPHARATLDPRTLPGLAQAEISTVIESDDAVIVDRTMTWDARGYGSHAETSVASPALTWYLAEGATHSGFDLFYLVQNPTLTTAEVRVTYLRPSPGAEVIKTYTVAPNSRFNIWVNRADAVLASTEVSAVISSLNGVPVIVERAMYQDGGGRTFSAGHESGGTTGLATKWMLAEGATGGYFDLFVLVAVPGPAGAEIDATYLLPDGTTLAKHYAVAGNSRRTIWVDHEDAALANTAVSVVLTSTNGVAFVAERAMWWPGTSETWFEAHNSAGVPESGSVWALAEGEVGGSRSTETYILLANVSPQAGSARVTLYFEDGTSAERVFPLTANSRFNVDVARQFLQAAGRRFGALVESLGSEPAQLVVERSMYSNAEGVVWAAGTNAVATRLR